GLVCRPWSPASHRSVPCAAGCASSRPSWPPRRVLWFHRSSKVRLGITSTSQGRYAERPSQSPNCRNGSSYPQNSSGPNCTEGAKRGQGVHERKKARVRGGDTSPWILEKLAAGVLRGAGRLFGSRLR